LFIPGHIYYSLLIKKRGFKFKGPRIKSGTLQTGTNEGGRGLAGSIKKASPGKTIF